MNFGNIGFTEILLISVVVLLLFGAKRLPEIGASMGKSIKEFKRGISDMDKSIREGTSESRRLPEADTVNSTAEEERPEPKRLMS
ncbi:MAG TPA: twin-arginine translocase TatA/TatE family subunit [Gemmatimonadaceae bacterium]|nr:twin-arginine translocase TatA/TatE family subunit [Gemmatimonadaceae bacterium]